MVIYADYRETHDTEKGHEYHFKLKPCTKCGHTEEVTVKGSDLYAYQMQGAYIQDAFADLNPNQRDRLAGISPWCDPCYNKIMID